MALTIDIDVGGTQTDGVFVGEGEIVTVKVDTTPHDVTVCFMECLMAGANKLGFPDLPSLLRNVSLIRWSSTITSNVLAQQTGPKVGMIVTPTSNKENLYGPQPSPAVGTLIDKRDIVSVSEGDIMRSVRELLERGVRRICISLEGAYRDPSQERDINASIHRGYPDHYLGRVPTVTGSEVIRHPDDMTRTHYALLTAYIMDPLSTSLFKAEDQLRDNYNFKGSFFIGHNNGGVSTIAKTKGIDTVEAGPAFGVYAASHLATIYGIDSVVSLDVGGTTSKVTPILNGAAATTEEGNLFSIPVKIPMPIMNSVALGGGSVVSVDNSELKIGPESMGAYPGPACYDLGGDKATLTDAFIELGLQNPDYFSGGRKTIDTEKATKAVQTKVADLLGVTAEEGARFIVGKASDVLADEIRKAVDMAGRQDPSNYALFAFGGNGPILGCSVAEKLGIRKVLAFELGSVLSAFGSSVSDLSHVYEHFPFIYLSRESLSNELPRIIEEIQREISIDSAGEGLDLKKISCLIQLDVRSDKGDRATVERTMSSLTLNAKQLEELFDNCYAELGVKEEESRVLLERLRVKTIFPISKGKLPSYKKAGSDATEALKGERSICINGDRRMVKCFALEKLQGDNTFEGPAVVEGENTTFVVPKGWKAFVDEHRNVTITK